MALTAQDLVRSANQHYSTIYEQRLKYPKSVTDQISLRAYQEQLIIRAKVECPGQSDEVLQDEVLMMIVPTLNFQAISKLVFTELLKRSAAYRTQGVIINQIGVYLPIGNHHITFDVSSWDSSTLVTIERPPEPELSLDLSDITTELGTHVSWSFEPFFEDQIASGLPSQIMFHDFDLHYKLSAVSIAKTRQLVQDNQAHLYVHAPCIINLSFPFTKKFPNDPSWIMSGVYHQMSLATRIGARGLVVHVGKHLKKAESNVAICNMYKNIRKILEYSSSECRFLLETPVGCGTEVLWLFDDFANFYDRFSYDERQVMAVCIDTCHVFAAGHDPLVYVRDWIDRFGAESIGLIHFNDSTHPQGTRVDRHKAIGQGYIPLTSLAGVAELARRYKIDMVLE